MMSRGTTYLRRLAGAVILALGLSSLTTRAYADASEYELLIEHSPVTGGKVTPNAGRHRFSANSTVAIAANPQPGYQFAYWLGDVADPTVERTTVLVNASKLVVAVFEPEPEKRLMDEVKLGGGFGGDMLSPTAIDLSSPGWSPAGGRRPDTRTVIITPIHTPEPATVVLLGLGTLALRRAGRRNHTRRHRPR